MNFICGTLNRNVHSLLLGARSNVFDSMLRSSFQVRSSCITPNTWFTLDSLFAQEGLSKKIELKEQDPHLATRMLEHLYSYDYSGGKISIGDNEEKLHVSELHTHAQMYELGDEYDIKDLKEESLWKFEKALKARKGQTDELKFVIKVIPTVYSTTLESDRGLRDVVVAFGADNLERMKDMPDFKSAATEVPLYMVEVLPKFLKRLEGEKKCYRGTACLKCYTAGKWKYSEVCCDRCQVRRKLNGEEMLSAT